MGSTTMSALNSCCQAFEACAQDKAAQMPPTDTQATYGDVLNYRQDPVPLCMAKKWLPVSHRHGCAIYRHDNISAEQQTVGGELMVSAIIKGSPQQCLAALTSSMCGNSILGPAAAVDVRQQTADGSSKVLCIYLAHPWSISSGSSGISSDTTLARSHCSSTKQPVSSALTRFCSRLFRRRCAVVQQSLWQDPRGIYCLTFNSLAQEELQQQQQQQDCCLIAPSSDQADNSSSNSSVHSLCKGDHAHPHSSSRSLPGVGDSCRAAPQQQQQMRHRWSSHPGKPMSSKQQQQHRQHGQSVQLHACCHQQGSDRRSNVARTRAKQQHQHHNQQRAQLQPQQRQRSATVLLLLQLFALLLSWLGSLLGLLGSLVGLQGSSSSSSRSWGLFGPVHVSVVGGFTVAGLDGGVDDEGPVTETLVTSILKVDPGGCLSSRTAGGGCMLCSAAVRVGVVDALVNQMLSAVERVKREVEHPPTVQQPAQAAHLSSKAGFADNLMSSVSSIASLALAPLAAWQGQQPQHTRPEQQRQQGPHLQRQHSQSKQHQQQQQQQQQSGGGRGASISSSSGGGKSSVTAAEGGFAVNGGGGMQELVGLDQQGNPLTGLCSPAFWSPLHQPGCPALFQVRGPSYLSDHVKVSAGVSAYTLVSVDLVSTPTAVHHLARYLPSVRRCRAASAFVVNMMVPAAHDVMNLVMTFGSSNPWPAQCSSINSSHSGSNGSNSGSSSSSGGSRTFESGFQNTLRRFLQASDRERSNMFKMIPHIQVGPWVLQGMVGTTPVIMGRKLETTYHLTDRYIEVDIDVTTCRTAGFIVQSIRGATTSLVVDLCYLLEGQKPDELPEELIGAVRFSNIDMSATTPLDISTEIPSWPQPW